MKTLILSDIHANPFACEAIWARERDSDCILCTGDLVDYGPFPCEALAWVQSHGVLCTQGNHDLAVAQAFRQGLRGDRVPPDARCWAHHNAGLLDEPAIRFLEQLPTVRSVELDGLSYGLTHAYRAYDELVSLEAYAAFAASAFGLPELRRMIFGHTHRQGVRYLGDDILWLNPGSTSYRRQDERDQQAHYATVTDGRIALRRVAYDLRPLRDALAALPLQESEMRVAEFFYGARGGSTSPT